MERDGESCLCVGCVVTDWRILIEVFKGMLGVFYLILIVKLEDEKFRTSLSMSRKKLCFCKFWIKMYMILLL